MRMPINNHQLREFTKSVIRQDSQIYYYDTEGYWANPVQAYYGIWMILKWRWLDKSQRRNDQI